MVTFFTPVRVLLFAAVLAIAAPRAEAVRHTTEPTAPAHTEKARPASADEGSLDGWLLLAGVVGVVVLVAWIASRFGDNRSHVTG